MIAKENFWLCEFFGYCDIGKLLVLIMLSHSMCPNGGISRVVCKDLGILSFIKEVNGRTS